MKLSEYEGAWRAWWCTCALCAAICLSVCSVFMGLFQQLPTNSDEATVWLMATGQILSCDGVFTDWLGYKQEDIHLSE